MTGGTHTSDRASHWPKLEEWQRNLAFTAVDEAQQFGTDREITAIAMLPPTSFILWTGDAQQTPGSIAKGGIQYARSRQQLMSRRHALRCPQTELTPYKLHTALLTHVDLPCVPEFQEMFASANANPGPIWMGRGMGSPMSNPKEGAWTRGPRVVGGGWPGVRWSLRPGTMKEHSYVTPPSRSVGAVLGDLDVSFFLLAGQLVHVTWSCSFIIGWWEVKKLYMILELGRSPLCTVKRETSWWKLWQKRFGSWTRSNSKNQKQGRGPPGTQAPPGQVPGDTAKEQTSQTTTWSNLQLLDYIHSTASCRNMLQQIENSEFLQTDACVKLYSGTLTDKRTWATQDDPRPALTLAFQSYIRRTSVQSRDVSSLPE